MITIFILTGLSIAAATHAVRRMKKNPTEPDTLTWDELIWGRDGKTYDPEADAEYTRLHQGDQGIQG